MDKRRFKTRRSWRFMTAAILLSIGGPMSMAHAYTTVSGFSYGQVCGPSNDGSQAGELEYDSSIALSCSGQDAYSSQAASYAAYARPGQLGVSASYSVAGRTDPGANLYTGLTQVSAGVFEGLTIVSGPLSGSIVFDIAVSGSTRTSTMNTEFSAGDARAGINGRLQNDPRGSQYTASTITLGENEGARNRVSIRVPYERGYATFNMSLSASAGCTNVSGSDGNSCTANADAFNSATVMGGQVFDENGVLVEGAVVTSDSGFDYLAGYSEPSSDGDEDGIDDVDDNCPADFNADQADLDEDGLGDVCDSDPDGDGVDDPLDNCPFLANADQDDVDEDTIGDACDGDVDGDGVANDDDLCPLSRLDEPAPSDWEGRKNRYWSDSTGNFVSGTGVSIGLTVVDTGGCTASQTIERYELGRGHRRFGLSLSALLNALGE